MSAVTATCPSAQPSLIPVIQLVNIDPSVVMNILDYHTRRGQKQNRVIGALYGVVCHDVIHVQQVIPIIHEEEAGRDSVTLGTTLWETMARSTRKVQLAPLIGWYASDTGPTDVFVDQLITSRIGPSNPAIRLILDATLKQSSLRLRVLCSTEVFLLEKMVRLYRHAEFKVRPCNAVQAAVLDGLIGLVNPNHIAAQRTSSRFPEAVASKDLEESTNSVSSGQPSTVPTNTSSSATTGPIPGNASRNVGTMGSTAANPSAATTLCAETSDDRGLVPTTLHRLRDVLDILLGQIDRLQHQTASGSSNSLTSEQIFEIQKALRSVPQFPAALAATLRDSAVQDGATMQYLARLIQVQVALVDRLLALVHL